MSIEQHGEKLDTLRESPLPSSFSDTERTQLIAGTGSEAQQTEIERNFFSKYEAGDLNGALKYMYDLRQRNQIPDGDFRLRNPTCHNDVIVRLDHNARPTFQMDANSNTCGSRY